MSLDLWESLRNLALGVGCVLAAGIIGGWTAAEWAAMRDWKTGRNQARPVWTAEERWGGR